MTIDRQIFLAFVLVFGLVNTSPGAVAVRCPFTPTAVAKVTSETGTPVLNFVQEGGLKGKVVKPELDELGVSSFQAYNAYGSTIYAIIRDVRGLTEKEGFTLAFRIRPRSRMLWRPVFGFRFGNHNYRLEQVATPKGSNPITLTLFQDNGVKLHPNMSAWHPKNAMELEHWYDVRLSYAKGVFTLFINGTEVDRYPVNGHAPGDSVTELILGTGRNGAAADAKVKAGLYIRLDDVMAWTGTSAQPNYAESSNKQNAPSAQPDLPAATADGSCVLAPKRGALPKWSHTLNGGTLRIQPAQARNPECLTIGGQGRVELNCPFSDLTIALNAQDFNGDVVLLDDATSKRRMKKLCSEGLQLGSEARLIISPGMQLFVTQKGSYTLPHILLSGNGEVNNEGFGALRIDHGQNLNSAIELAGAATIAANGILSGRIYAPEGTEPQLTLGRREGDMQAVPLLRGITVNASIGTPTAPLALLINGSTAELRGGSFTTRLTVQAPTRLTAGYHRSDEVNIAPMQSLIVEKTGMLDAKRIFSTGNLIIGKGGTLSGGCSITGSCVFMDGAQLQVRAGATASLSLLALQHTAPLQIVGNPTGMQGGRNKILTWAVSSEPPTSADFALSPKMPAGCELELEGNALYLKVPYSVAMGDTQVKLCNSDGTPAQITPDREAISFIVATAQQQQAFTDDIILKVEGATSETPEMDAGQAVNVAYLLNLHPQISRDKNTVTAQYLCNFGISEVRRVGNNRVEATVLIEPFDGMGTLGDAPNGYIQILGKCSAEDRQWAVLAEIAPQTPYHNGTLTSAPFRNVHKEKTFRIFGVRITATSARK
mgnify:CR=1 FL=1